MGKHYLHPQDVGRPERVPCPTCDGEGSRPRWGTQANDPDPTLVTCDDCTDGTVPAPPPEIRVTAHELDDGRTVYTWQTQDEWDLNVSRPRGPFPTEQDAVDDARVVMLLEPSGYEVLDRGGTWVVAYREPEVGYANTVSDGPTRHDAITAAANAIGEER